MAPSDKVYVLQLYKARFKQEAIISHLFNNFTRVEETVFIPA